MELEKKKFLIVLVLKYVYKHTKRHLYLNPRGICFVTLLLIFSDSVCQYLETTCSLAVLFVSILLFYYFLYV